MIHKNIYISSMLLIEKTYKGFLSLIKAELDILKISDINNIQALLLYQIGNSEMSIAELMTNGYYSGSNASYNIKKMVAAKYIEQTKSKHDKRSSVIKLTNKGIDLIQKMDIAFVRHSNLLTENLNLNDIYDSIKTICTEINRRDMAQRDVFLLKKNIRNI